MSDYPYMASSAEPATTPARSAPYLSATHFELANSNSRLYAVLGTTSPYYTVRLTEKVDFDNLPFDEHNTPDAHFQSWIIDTSKTPLAPGRWRVTTLCSDFDVDSLSLELTVTYHGVPDEIAGNPHLSLSILYSATPRMDSATRMFGRPISGCPRPLYLESKAAVEERQLLVRDWEPLGSGHFGVTYRVRDIHNQYYALKEVTMPFDIADQSNFDEIKPFFLLQDKQRIVQLIDFRIDEVSQRLLLQMTYYKGGDMQKLLRTTTERGSHFDEHSIRSWTFQLCVGLRGLETKKMVHNDIAPRNIFFEDNSYCDLVIGDLGIARRLKNKSASGKVFQWNFEKFRSSHMAPELWRTVNRLAPSVQSDMWSVGCVILECMTLVSGGEDGSRWALMDENALWAWMDHEALSLWYSQDMWQLVKDMMRYYPQHRITASAATERINRMEQGNHINVNANLHSFAGNNAAASASHQRRSTPLIADINAAMIQRPTSVSSRMSNVHPQEFMQRRAPLAVMNQHNANDNNDIGNALTSRSSHSALSAPLLRRPLNGRGHNSALSPEPLSLKSLTQRTRSALSRPPSSLSFADRDRDRPASRGDTHAAVALDDLSSARSTITPVVTDYIRADSFGVWRKLFAFLDQFVPEGIRTLRPPALHHTNVDDFLTSHRLIFASRLAVTLTVVNLILGAVGFIQQMTADDALSQRQLFKEIVVIACVLYMFFCCVVLYFLKVSRNKTLSVIGNLIVFEEFCLLIYESILTGGTGLSFFISVMLQPTLCVIFVGEWAGLIWSLLLLADLVAMFVLEKFGYNPLLSEGDSAWLIPAGVLLLIIQFGITRAMKYYHSIAVSYLQQSLTALGQSKDIISRCSYSRLRFLRSMSHEVRQPLTHALEHMHSVLLAQPPLSDDRQNELEQAYLASQSVYNLINDMIDLSNLEVGTFQFDEETVDIVSQIETACRSVATHAQSRGLELVCDISPFIYRDRAYIADALRFSRVVRNLLAAAIMAGGTDAVILRAKPATWDQQTMKLQIDVSFSPATNPSPITSSASNGTSAVAVGGDEISIMLVDLWGGDLWSEYAANGLSSSTHHVTYPMRIATDVRGEHRTLIAPEMPNLDVTNPNGLFASRVGGPYRNSYVLIVDDHLHSRRVISRMIGACRVNVGECGKVDDALAFVDKLLIELYEEHLAQRSQNYSHRHAHSLSDADYHQLIIFVDQRMPFASGDDLLFELQKRYPTWSGRNSAAGSGVSSTGKVVPSMMLPLLLVQSPQIVMMTSAAPQTPVTAPPVSAERNESRNGFAPAFSRANHQSFGRSTSSGSSTLSFHDDGLEMKQERSSIPLVTLKEDAVFMSKPLCESDVMEFLQQNLIRRDDPAAQAQSPHQQFANYQVVATA